ncbi:ACT domain-containing protein [Helicobacter rodentium]|uniref:ACT domain-containing protein n=1 Tax=Helicobacter rodentium TaxID=59617 RepID=UPI000479E915|nr:ACT domain-containing protein [Helicobacter rodentium]
MKIGILEGEFFIYKVAENLVVDKNIFCLVQEIDGFSVIAFAHKEKHFPIFKAFYLDELNDFSESGILYQALKPLKENHISVLVISALNRDYIFIDKKHFEQAIKLMGIQ